MCNIPTIHMIAYNEQELLPYTIEHYRSRFPDAKIIIYDNFSDDNTSSIVETYGCELKQFWTGNELSDKAFVDVKNNCWKHAAKGWQVVCDIDEWLDITPETLKKADEQGVSILRTVYYEMVGSGEKPDKIKKGVFYPDPGKFLCFNSLNVEEINYEYGCHKATPFGRIKFSENPTPIYHYKYLSLEYVIKRHAHFGKRLSSHNLRNKLSFHYLFSKSKLTKHYEKLVLQSSICR